MKLLSPFLACALGAVVGTAPAAPVVLARPVARPAPQRTDAPRDAEHGEEKTPRVPAGAPVVARVVLRTQGESQGTVDLGGAGPAETPDVAPSLRARRLARVRPPLPPVLRAGDDVRAGLRSLPPPGA